MCFIEYHQYWTNLVLANISRLSDKIAHASHIHTHIYTHTQGAITINCNSQIQAMQESKGHPFKFRVLDGSKNVGYEISASSEKAMKEWMYQIRLVSLECVFVEVSLCFLHTLHDRSSHTHAYTCMHARALIQAIQTHVIVGRNFLHRYCLAEANMPKPSKGVVSVDGQPTVNSHRYV